MKKQPGKILLYYELMFPCGSMPYWKREMLPQPNKDWEKDQSGLVVMGYPRVVELTQSAKTEIKE